MSAKKVPGESARSQRTPKPAKTAGGNSSEGKTEGFTAEERAAIREYAQERKAAARRGGRGADKAQGENDLLAAIAKMPEPDRSMAKRLHVLIKAAAPDLSPKTWYGMPAYANAEGQVVCFFQNAQKFKTRYSTLGFSDKAKLDNGNMWPSAFALKELTAEVEARIAELVKVAIS